METCANPGCHEPGTNKCAGCKITPYCSSICQTAHWPTHKESCDGRLRKMGMDHLAKAMGAPFGGSSIISTTTKSQIIFDSITLRREHTIFLKPHFGWQRLKACHRERSRKQDRKRLCSYAERWTFTLSCMGPSVLQPPMT